MTQRLFKGSGAFFAGVGVGCAVVALAFLAGHFFGSPNGEICTLSGAFMVLGLFAGRPARVSPTRPNDLPLKAEQPGYSRLDVPKRRPAARNSRA